MSQFGIAADPALDSAWQDVTIADDALGAASNVRGTVSYATSGVNARTTQLFINTADNSYLDDYDGYGFMPIGEVVSGMDVVDAFYDG